MRVRILEALNDGAASASELSEKLEDATRDDVTYHLRVLGEQCGLVERVDSRPSQGGVEYVYGLSSLPLDELVPLVTRFSQTLTMEPVRAILQAFFAANTGSFLVSAETTIAVVEVALDGQVINDTLLGTIEQVRSMAEVGQGGSAEPGSDQPVVAGVVLFR